ncbi:MAG: response regulator [Planctomycetaceae bacterium]
MSINTLRTLTSAQEQSARRGSSCRGIGVRFHGGPINILIVDDEPKNLTVLETVLNDPAYRLVRAESADQALLALLVEEFALLILDIRMPNMTGFELAQIIKERKKTAAVPIIFLTAYFNEDQHVLEGYCTGAVDYLHKPVNATILRSKVAVFAELYNKSRECGMVNRALLAEVNERRRAEEQLHVLNETLKMHVTERTEALAMTSSALNEVGERYRLLFEGSLDAIFSLSPDGRFTAANPAALRLTGQTIENLESVRFQDLFTIDQPAENAFPAPNGRECFTMHTTAITATGDRCHLFVSGSPTIVADKVVGVSCIGHDITERVQLETQLREQAAALSEMHRRKDEFLAMLSHELRSPLAAISNATQLLGLQRGSENQIQEKARSIIHRQMLQLQHLVDDLLEVSRITTGRVQLRLEPIDVVSIVERAVETVRALIDQRQHELTVSLPPKPIKLQADASRLEQVIVNLLTNAAKYTEEGGQIWLTVELDHDTCIIRVRDTGVGITPELLPRIFDLFTQADRSLDRSQGGLGIGLALVQRLTELQGGKVEACSVLGQGSEFVVRLPALPDEMSQKKSLVTAPRELTTRSLRVLVVDDNVDTVMGISILLKASGHDVRTAFDGPTALQAAIDHRPDVMLLDIGLPGLNGYEVAKRIRQDPELGNITLVASTGYGQDSDRQNSLQAGFNYHLVKPAHFEELQEILAMVAKVELKPTECS